jgi:hypothetical protein
LFAWWLVKRVVATFLALILVSQPSQVLAYGCDPFGADAGPARFAGAINTAYTTINGVSARIYQYRPFVSFQVDRAWASTAWVMLEGPTGYAQTGWVQYRLGVRHTLVAWVDWTGENQPVKFFDPQPDWSFVQTTVLYEPAAGGQMRYRFYAAGEELIAVNAWHDPTQGTIASEINNTKAQLAGNFGAPQLMWFTDMKKRTNQWWAFAPTDVGYKNANSTIFYVSNTRPGMDPDRELATADRRGDCS